MSDVRKVEGVVLDDNNEIVFDPRAEQEQEKLREQAKRLPRVPLYMRVLSVVLLLPFLMVFGAFALFVVLLLLLFGRRVKLGKMSSFVWKGR